MSWKEVATTIWSLFVLFLIVMTLWGKQIVAFVAWLFWVLIIILAVIGIVYFIIWFFFLREGERYG